MRLDTLLERLPTISPHHSENPVIQHVKTDSRWVNPGDLFIAIKGTQHDGHQSLRQAVQNGAAAVLVEHTVPDSYLVPVIRVPSTREAFSTIMQAWYGYPADSMRLCAVTGSNGKTSVAFLLYSLLNRTKNRCGLIGTAGYYSAEIRLEDTLQGPATTPDPDQLHHMLHRFQQDRCTTAVMEASSFGIEQKRLFGLQFDAILWTNFSPNHHVQYHLTEEAYFQAKSALLHQIKPNGLVILNRDMKGFDECKGGAPNAISIGFHPKADLVIRAVEKLHPGLRMNFRYQDSSYQVTTPLIGDFQTYNLAQVFVTAIHLGIPEDEIIHHLSSIRQIPGRWVMWEIKEVPFSILIDKANTIVSLKALLESLRSQSYHHKILVYGQVGGGEPSQRKEAGAFFSNHFDKIILTTDDPENEDPMIGITQFMEGVPAQMHAHILVELSREKAIRLAIQSARPHDLVAVLGRGNQREFLVQGRTKIFDDVEECGKIIRSFGWKV